MSLPLSDRNIFCGRLLLPCAFRLGLPVLVPGSYQFLFKGTWLSIVRPAGKQLRFRALDGGDLGLGCGLSIGPGSVHHLFLWRRLAVRDVYRCICRPGTFGRHGACSVRGVGGIRHVCKRPASRHVQGGLARRGYEYCCHKVTIHEDTSVGRELSVEKLVNEGEQSTRQGDTSRRARKQSLRKVPLYTR
jgi:hypothetical protein